MTRAGFVIWENLLAILVSTIFLGALLVFWQNSHTLVVDSERAFQRHLDLSILQSALLFDHLSSKKTVIEADKITFDVIIKGASGSVKKSRQFLHDKKTESVDLKVGRRAQEFIEGMNAFGFKAESPEPGCTHVILKRIDDKKEIKLILCD